MNFLVVMGFLPIWKILFRIIVGFKILRTRSCYFDRSRHVNRELLESNKKHSILSFQGVQRPFSVDEPNNNSSGVLFT